MIQKAKIDNGSDRRIFERFPARFPAKVKDARDDFGTNIYLRNASAQGARLMSKERMFLNDNVSLEVKLPDNEFPMTLRGQVVWAQNTDANLWDVGVRFHAISLMHISRLYKFVVSHP